jgi:hypothetical protein
MAGARSGSVRKMPIAGPRFAGRLGSRGLAWFRAARKPRGLRRHLDVEA